MLKGHGELVYRRQGDAYEVRLTGTVLGMRALDQTSQGHLDRAGFAPDRFIDKRLAAARRRRPSSATPAPARRTAASATAIARWSIRCCPARRIG